MKFQLSLLVLASTCITQSIAAAFPREDNPLAAILEARDDDQSDWAPPGAPPPLPGQTFLEYLDNILGGEGEIKNEPHKKKRDYVEKYALGTTYWEEESGRFNASIVDAGCRAGLKPHLVVGDITLENGDELLDVTVGQVNTILMASRRENKESRQKIEEGYAKILHMNAGTAGAIAEEEMKTGLIRSKNPDANAKIELRKLLDIKKIPYYLILLSGSLSVGAVIGGVQAGIVHATSEVELGWENWLISAVGYAISIFAATEFSRFAPRISQAGLYSPLMVFVWAKKKIRESRAARLSRASAALAAGGATNAASNAANADYVTPQQAADNLAHLSEIGQAGLQHGLQSVEDTANILNKEIGTGRCRS